MRKTELKVLVSALRILVKDIQSDDGVANMCIHEAADRIEEMEQALRIWKSTMKNELHTMEEERLCYDLTCIALGEDK